MTVITSLWASVQGDPKFMHRANGWLPILSVVMIPVLIVTGWVSSVQYVSVLTLWALVLGCWSAWGQAARVEVKQEAEFQRARKIPREQRVVEKLVKETSLEPTLEAS